MRRDDGDEKIWSSKQRCTSTTEMRQSMHPLMDGQLLQHASFTKNYFTLLHTNHRTWKYLGRFLKRVR